MTTISILITTYDDPAWEEMAWTRAHPSAALQEPEEIIIRHYRDLSIGPARNATAKEATGDFLIHLDADDELHPNYLAAMRTALNTNNDSLALFQPAVQYTRKNRVQPPQLFPPGDLRVDNFLVVGTMVSRNLFNQVGGFEDYPHGFEDWSLWAKCWKAGASVVQVPEAIYIAHINPYSKHRQLWRNRREQVATHLRVAAELFPGGPEVWAR